MSDQALPLYILQLWQRHLPNTLGRLDVLEKAIGALLSGELSKEELARAISETHKLAGSLGSYGLPQGSDLARKVEMTLENGDFAGDTLLLLSEDVVQIRRLIEAGPAPSAAPSVPEPGKKAEGQPSIVLVEDDVLLRELLIHAFTLHNFTVKAYAEGDSALRELMSESPVRPALLILDIDLPGTSGMTILRQLSAAGITKQIKIMMLTARNSEAEIMNSLRLGALDHVSKPFSVPILLEKVHRILA